MMTVEVELLILIVLVVVLASGAIEYLRQIRNAIQENYQASLARAMTTTDIAVTPTKEKVVKPCICGHAQSQHEWFREHPSPSGRCSLSDCECGAYKPKRGPWPGELKV